jgi:hypothetical protein
MIVEPTPDAVFASVPGGGVVLHTGTKRYYSLNETSARIWSLLEQTRDPQLVAAHIAAEYVLPASDAEVAVNQLVTDFIAAGLIRAVSGTA